MSNHSIGNRFELEAKHELEKYGFIVFKPVRTKFSITDVFGIFDLLAYNPMNHNIKFIQVTSLDKDHANIEKVSTVKSRLKKVEEFEVDFAKTELWCYIRDKEKTRYKWVVQDYEILNLAFNKKSKLYKDSWKVKKEKSLAK